MGCFVITLDLLVIILKNAAAGICVIPVASGVFSHILECRYDLKGRTRCIEPLRCAVYQTGLFAVSLHKAVPLVCHRVRIKAGF